MHLSGQANLPRARIEMIVALRSRRDERYVGRATGVKQPPCNLCAGQSTRRRKTRRLGVDIECNAPVARVEEGDGPNQILREGARRERRTAAAADAEGAMAGVAGLEALRHDLVLVAPIAGIVITRAVEAGEMVAPGQAALVLGETTRQRVRVFVNQGALSRVQPGQTVHARLDAYPGSDFTGRVVAVSTQAEFTPRVALTEKERADLLFGVKIEFADTTGMLKAGLPITVHIDAPARAP